MTLTMTTQRGAEVYTQRCGLRVCFVAVVFARNPLAPVFCTCLVSVPTTFVHRIHVHLCGGPIHPRRFEILSDFKRGGLNQTRNRLEFRI